MIKYFNQSLKISDKCEDNLLHFQLISLKLMMIDSESTKGTNKKYKTLVQKLKKKEIMVHYGKIKILYGLFILI